MSRIIVLALDIAKHRTGWAVNSLDFERPFWGVYELAGEWEKNEGLRLHQWRNFLEAKIRQHSVTYVAMERPFIDMKDFNYNGSVPILQMWGIALELAQGLQIRHGNAPIGSWRSHFLGTAQAPAGLPKAQRTNALKDMATRQAAKRGWLTQYHDEAEALGIADFALSCLDADYEHKVGPDVRRAELKAEIAAFRGDAP